MVTIQTKLQITNSLIAATRSEAFHLQRLIRELNSSFIQFTHLPLEFHYMSTQRLICELNSSFSSHICRQSFSLCIRERFTVTQCLGPLAFFALEMIGPRPFFRPACIFGLIILFFRGFHPLKMVTLHSRSFWFWRMTFRMQRQKTVQMQMTRSRAHTTLRASTGTYINSDPLGLFNRFLQIIVLHN